MTADRYLKTWGHRAIVVSSPTWPPGLGASAMKPSTQRLRRRTRVVRGPQDTLTPASFPAGQTAGTPAGGDHLHPLLHEPPGASRGGGVHQHDVSPEGLVGQTPGTAECSAGVAFHAPRADESQGPALDTAAAKFSCGDVPIAAWDKWGTRVPRISLSFIILPCLLSRPPAGIRLLWKELQPTGHD